MIEGLGKILDGAGQPGVAELRGLLEELLGGREASGCLLEQRALKTRDMRVFHLRFAVNNHARSVFVKRLRPEIARRNELVAKRWLPAIGLNDSGPPLLGSAAARSGACVWHVYEDLGRHELDPRAADREHVRAAVELIARIHTQFARHALLGEVRLNGGDLGIHFYESNVHDAICALEALRPSALNSQPSTSQLRDRLLKRLNDQRDHLPRRAHAMAEWGGPETLLHGDLWAINVFVIPTENEIKITSESKIKTPASPLNLNPDLTLNLRKPTQASGYRARLIDWDHAAVGPATYDLSTFLLRFPSEHRSWVLELYRQAVAAAGWRLPDERDLNSLFETHEYARFTNRIIWPAIAVAQDRAEWGIDALTEIEEWFEQFEPVLPVAAEVPA